MDGWLHRKDAGEKLAEVLEPRLREAPRLLILALPRGGVPVAFPVARRLNAPLDVLIVRKLGAPHYPELAMGAVTNCGNRVLNDEVIARYEVTNDTLDAVTRQELEELERREALYRDGLAPLDVEGRTVVLVDDGLATGASMRAALRSLKTRGAARLIVAVPVGPVATCASLKEDADEIYCLETPEPFASVGLWYQDFTQTTDAEVKALLAEAHLSA